VRHFVRLAGACSTEQQWRICWRWRRPRHRVTELARGSAYLFGASLREFCATGTRHLIQRRVVKADLRLNIVSITGGCAIDQGRWRPSSKRFIVKYQALRPASRRSAGGCCTALKTSLLAMPLPARPAKRAMSNSE